MHHKTMERRERKRCRLVCEECGAVTGERAPGWRVFLVSDEEELALEDCVVSFCPACAAREFDGEQ
jgi:hypothetical protein